MTQPQPDKLPDLPSDLIELSLVDLEKAEKHPDYRVNMATWHRSIFEDEGTDFVSRGKVCEVCQAGAVMAFSLNVPTWSSMRPDHFDNDTDGKLEAINFFRQGMIKDGLIAMFMYDDPRAKRMRKALGNKDFHQWMPEGERVVEYHDNRRAFKAQMCKLKLLFKEYGL